MGWRRSSIARPARVCCWPTRRPATTPPSRDACPICWTEWSVRRLVEAGADAIKILLYYNPFDDAGINTVKHAFIERIGAECAALDVPFFLEPLAYDDALGDEKGFEFAKKKPDYVARYMEEFSKPRYGVDILKVEVPVNMAFVEGTSAFKGQAAYSRADALRLFSEAASAASKPFIYLSAGVTDEVFRETLELAAEAGTPSPACSAAAPPGRMASRSTARRASARCAPGWKTAASRTSRCSTRWSRRAPKPWWNAYGGKENIEVVG